jgi:hypothetical protein
MTGHQRDNTLPMFNKNTSRLTLIMLTGFCYEA